MLWERRGAKRKSYMLKQQEAFSVGTSIRSEEAAAAAAANVLLLNANGEIDVREGGMTEGKKREKRFWGRKIPHTAYMARQIQCWSSAKKNKENSISNRFPIKVDRHSLNTTSSYDVTESFSCLVSASVDFCFFVEHFCCISCTKLPLSPRAFQLNVIFSNLSIDVTVAELKNCTIFLFLNLISRIFLLKDLRNEEFCCVWLLNSSGCNSRCEARQSKLRAIPLESDVWVYDDAVPDSRLNKLST